MDPHNFEEFRTGSASRSVLLICNELNADPDPAFYLRADPNPDPESQTNNIHVDPDPGTNLFWKAGIQIFFLIVNFGQFPLAWIRNQESQISADPQHWSRAYDSKSGSLTLQWAINFNIVVTIFLKWRLKMGSMKYFLRKYASLRESCEKNKRNFSAWVKNGRICIWIKMEIRFKTLGIRKTVIF